MIDEASELPDWAKLNPAAEPAPAPRVVAKESRMRRFVLDRQIDKTGTSGTSVVAEGVEFSNGRVSMHWLSQLDTTTLYDNIRVVETLHGHDGATSVRWIDT